MASRAARAARIKAKKEKHKARKATTARLNPRRRGRPLYERDADAAASALLVKVGEELSERPEVARRVLSCFDYCGLARAACVSSCWRTASLPLARLREQEFWAREKWISPALAKLDQFSKWFAECVERSKPSNLNAELMRRSGPIAFRFGFLFENGLGAHVLDADGTSVAAYVAFLEYAQSKNVSGDVLVVARDESEELARWNAALRGKSIFRGDNFIIDTSAKRVNGDLRVYVCSENNLYRFWKSKFKLLVVDVGGGSMCSMMPNRLRVIQTENSYLFSRPLSLQGLDLSEILWRIRFVNNSVSDMFDDEVLRLILRNDTAERRYLGELVRRDFARRLASSADCSIDVAELVATHRRDLAQRTCLTCGRQESDRLPVCGACGAVPYCSRDCQRAGWDAGHRTLCSRARHKRSRRLCDVCGKRGDIAAEAFPLCGGCDRRYCSLECAQADWDSGHSQDCPGVLVGL